MVPMALPQPPPGVVSAASRKTFAMSVLQLWLATHPVAFPDCDHPKEIAADLLQHFPG
jgi:hypothetical protein